jgi:hypothetical protein
MKEDSEREVEERIEPPSVQGGMALTPSILFLEHPEYCDR